jgi:hypothetical protein
MGTIRHLFVEGLPSEAESNDGPFTKGSVGLSKMVCFIFHRNLVHLLMGMKNRIYNIKNFIEFPQEIN